MPKASTRRTQRTAEKSACHSQPSARTSSASPLCPLWPFSVFSVLLILRFVASRAEMLPSEAVLASIWSAHVWLRLRRAMLNSEKLKKLPERVQLWPDRSRQLASPKEDRRAGCPPAALLPRKDQQPGKPA